MVTMIMMMIHLLPSLLCLSPLSLSMISVCGCSRAAARASPGEGAAGTDDADDRPVLHPMREDLERRPLELVRAGLHGHVHGQVW